MVSIAEKRLYEDKPTADGVLHRNPYAARGRLENNIEPFGWTEYRNYVKNELPIIRWSKLESIWKIPYYNILYRIFKHLSENTLSLNKRDNVLKIALGGFFDGYKNRFKSQASVIPFDIFPRLRTWVSFAEGATNIDEVYTCEHKVGGKTYEFPVYLRANPEGGTPKDPKPDELKENIDFVKTNNASRYDKMSTTESGMFFNEDFKAYSMNKLTRLDYRRYFQSEPERAHRWAVKDDTWKIVKNGLRDTAKEATVNATLPAGYQVKIYKRPTSKSGFWYNLGKYLMFDETPRSWTMFWYWLLRDISYDIIDTFLDPGEYAMRKAKVPEDRIRDYVETGWKASAAAVRAFQGPTNYTYAAAA